MRTLRFVPVLVLLGITTLATSLHAEVSTTLQFFGALGPDLTFTKNDVRIVSDSQTRDDATARATAPASADIGLGDIHGRGYRAAVHPQRNGNRGASCGTRRRYADHRRSGTDPVPVVLMAVDGDLILPDSANGMGNGFATVQALLSASSASSETATSNCGAAKTMQLRRHHERQPGRRGRSAGKQPVA